MSLEHQLQQEQNLLGTELSYDPSSPKTILCPLPLEFELKASVKGVEMGVPLVSHENLQLQGTFHQKMVNNKLCNF